MLGFSYFFCFIDFKNVRLKLKKDLYFCTYLVFVLLVYVKYMETFEK